MTDALAGSTGSSTSAEQPIADQEDLSPAALAEESLAQRNARVALAYHSAVFAAIHTTKFTAQLTANDAAIHTAYRATIDATPL